MRQYRFQATDTTVEALRALRGAWRGMSIAEQAVHIILQDGRVVRVATEAADVEDRFEAFRITAEVGPNPGVYGVPMEDFISGGNDVVLFTGASWCEALDTVRGEGIAEGSTMHFSGHPGQLSETAEVVCLTTDAFVVASSAGRGMLVRVGLRPGSLDSERDPEKVRAFLVERGYENDS